MFRVGKASVQCVAAESKGYRIPHAYINDRYITAMYPGKETGI